MTVTLRDEVSELNTRLQLTESALDNARAECDELGAQLQQTQSEVCYPHQHSCMVQNFECGCFCSQAEAQANNLQQAVLDAEEHSAALFEELERVRGEFQVPQVHSILPFCSGFLTPFYHALLIQDETDLVAHLSSKWQDLQHSIESARSTSDAIRQELESCQAALGNFFF
jgi:chaperonin cofactor prefoldin